MSPVPEPPPATPEAPLPRVVSSDAGVFATGTDWLAVRARERLVVVGSALGISVLAHLVLRPTLTAAIGVLAAWLGLAAGLWWRWSSAAAPRLLHRTLVTGQVLDSIAVAVLAHTLGATWWLAPPLLILVAVRGAAVVGRAAAIGLSVVATTAYAMMLVVELSDWWPLQGLFAVAPPVTWEVALASIVMLGGTLWSVALGQQRLVDRIASIEQRHAHLLANARDMVVTVDRQGRYLSTNPAVEAQLGWSAQHILGDDMMDSIADADRAAAALLFAQVLGGEAAAADLRVRNAQESLRLLRVTGSPIRDEAGQVIAAMFLGRDITEERAQAERLAERERQLRLLVRSVNETVFTVDRALRFSAIFGRWEADAPVPADALVGRSIREVLGPRVGAAFEGPLRRALAGEKVEFEQLVPHLEPPRVYRLSVTPLRDDDGAIVGATGVAYDVSAQRAAERERDQLRERLEDARRIEAIGRLVSGVAHELNNPLAAILNLSEQLRSEARGDDDVAALDTIIGQAVRSRAIVRDLLAFARPGGHRPRRHHRVDHLVHTALEPLRSHLAQSAVEIVPPAEQAESWVVADVIGLEQVVTNLVLNAVHAVGPGGRVDIGVSVEADHVVLTVQDDGPGFDAAAIPRLFEPFYTTKPVGRGTGLGLFVSLGIVQQHEGTLRASNREDRPGARVEVRLPKASAPGRAPTPPSVLSTLVADAAASYAPSVLLVDDEQSIRLSLRRFFERRHWTVLEADHGEQALALIAEHGAEAFTMVLCDIRMPVMDGIALHAALRRTAPALLERLVFASGDIVSPEVAALMQGTRCRVLEKPFELKALAEEADRLLASRSGHEDLP